MSEEEDKSLSKKIVKTLCSKKDYQTPKVSPEGYGSFINSKHEEIDPSRAEFLKNQADAIDNKSAIPIYLDSLYCYFKSTTTVLKTEDMRQYLINLRFLTKYIDHIIQQAKKFKCEREVAILEWASFNLKLIKLMSESNLLSKTVDATTYFYLLDMLKTLENYWNSKSANPTTIVRIEDMEEEMKRRL